MQTFGGTIALLLSLAATDASAQTPDSASREVWVRTDSGRA